MNSQRNSSKFTSKYMPKDFLRYDSFTNKLAQINGVSGNESETSGPILSRGDDCRVDADSGFMVSAGPGKFENLEMFCIFS